MRLPDLPERVPCLSVKNPHAWALVFGAKRIENRSWPCRYRGPLVIHAGKSASAMNARADYPGCPDRKGLTFGALVGLVELVACVPFEEVRGWPYAEGPWCWGVRPVMALEPVPLAGKLGLFTVDRSLLRPLVARDTDAFTLIP